MTIGFTGTRHGLTEAQYAALRARLSRCDPATTRAIHGSCVGADAEFDGICADLGIHRTARPGLAVGHPLRAVLDCEVTLPIAPIWTRNEAIVADAAQAEHGVLLVCPREDSEQGRGGTWGTFRLGAGRVLRVVFWPDGRMERFEPEPST